jgi:hypothetical protein
MLIAKSLIALRGKVKNSILFKVAVLDDDLKTENLTLK